MMKGDFEAGMNIDRSQNSHIVAPNERSYCEKGTYKVEPQSSFAYMKSRHIVALVVVTASLQSRIKQKLNGMKANFSITKEQPR
jgi:hypothetical protein